MSVEALKWGRLLVLPNSRMKVHLMVLCDYAQSGYGEKNATKFYAHPKRELIEQWSQMSRTTVRLALRDLVELGVIELVSKPAPGHVSTYCVDITKTQQLIDAGTYKNTGTSPTPVTGVPPAPDGHITGVSPTSTGVPTVPTGVPPALTGVPTTPRTYELVEQIELDADFKEELEGKPPNHPIRQFAERRQALGEAAS